MQRQGRNEDSNQNSDDEAALAARLSAYEAGELGGAESLALRALLDSPGPSGADARRVLARLTRLRAATAALPPPALSPARREAVADRVLARVRTGRQRRAGVLAGATLLAAAAVIAVWRRPPPVPSPLPLAAGTLLRTGPGDFQLLPLGERGVAFVGEDTELVASPGATPALRLMRGSVRLVIRRRVAQPSQPFVVATPAADVEVLGTEFDVSVREGTTEVNVVRGVVEVRNPQGRQRLWAREAAVARAGTPPRPLVPVRGVVSEGAPEVKIQPP